MNSITHFSAVEYKALQQQALANHEQVLALKEGRQPRIAYRDFAQALQNKRNDPIDAMADQIIKACGAYVRRSVSPLFERVAELEARIEKLEQER